MRCATGLTALALAITAGGCGSASTPPPTVAARTLFSGSCGGCHTLTGHNIASRQGGDLLGVRLRRSVALQFAREMPVPHPLTPAQLNTIVDYIAAVQRGNR
jgi:mono/diheme cytochrome c family protein